MSTVQKGNRGARGGRAGRVAEAGRLYVVSAPDHGSPGQVRRSVAAGHGVILWDEWNGELSSTAQGIRRKTKTVPDTPGAI